MQHKDAVGAGQDFLFWKRQHPFNSGRFFPTSNLEKTSMALHDHETRLVGPIVPLFSWKMVAGKAH